MTNSSQRIIHRPALALGLVLTLSTASLPACSLGDEPTALGLRSAEGIFSAATDSTATSPSSPLVVGPTALAELQTQVLPFHADEALATSPMALFTANVVEIIGVDGQLLTLARVPNGMRVQGVEGDYGIRWTSDFSQIAFQTPEGTYRMAVAGTLDERRQLVATLSILSLGGTAEPAAAMAAVAWPAVAIIGIVVVSWGVLCLAYTQTCLNEAEQVCAPNGAASVTVGDDTGLGGSPSGTRGSG